MSDEKRAAAIAMLEAELERRIEERLASGDLVRSADSGVIVTGVPDCDVPLPKRWIEKVENGPDILHEPWGVIVTGVPRAGDDDDEVVSHTPTTEPAPAIGRPDRLPPAPKPAEPQEPVYVAPSMPRERIFITVRPPDDNGFPGEIAEGCFSVVEDGTLQLTDMSGAYLGARRLREGDNPMAVARQLLRDSIDAGSDFNKRTLQYPRAGIA